MRATAELPTEDALDLIAASNSAAFAIDRHDRIVYWNAGAEELLGWPSSEAVGRACFEVMAGRDAFGNLYCTRECPIVRAAASGEVLEPYFMDVRTKAGESRKILVRAVALPAPGEAFSCLMHLIEKGDAPDVDRLVQSLRAAARPSPQPLRPEPAMAISPLTTREREIVTLLSNGFAALNIAARLNLSHATVRNHIQNILRKLEVHSQVEAIALAFRRGWL